MRAIVFTQAMILAACAGTMLGLGISWPVAAAFALLALGLGVIASL